MFLQVVPVTACLHWTSQQAIARFKLYLTFPTKQLQFSWLEKTTSLWIAAWTANNVCLFNKSRVNTKILSLAAFFWIWPVKHHTVHSFWAPIQAHQTPNAEKLTPRKRETKQRGQWTSTFRLTNVREQVDSVYLCSAEGAQRPSRKPNASNDEET